MSRVVVIFIAVLLASCEPEPRPDHIEVTIARPHCHLHKDAIDCTVKRLPK